MRRAREYGIDQPDSIPNVETPEQSCKSQLASTDPFRGLGDWETLGDLGAAE